MAIDTVIIGKNDLDLRCSLLLRVGYGFIHPCKVRGNGKCVSQNGLNLFYQTMIVDVYNPNSICILGVSSAMLMKITKFGFVVCFPSLIQFQNQCT